VTGDFSHTDFPSWFDISEEKKEETVTTGPTGYPQVETVVTTVATPPWFQSFIQRSFLESYSLLFADNEGPNKWVSGFRSIFKVLTAIGPYHDALENMGDHSPPAQEMEDWFKGARDYVTACYEPAKEIAAKYVSAGLDFFRAATISDQERNGFLTAVSDADLTGPLVAI
jgi:hypothetical protein